MKSKATLRHWFLFILILCLFLTGVTTAFYFYVNWQGEKQWTEMVASLKARGEPTNWKDVVPPPIPDSENFSATPLLACFYKYTREGKTSELNYTDPSLVKTAREINLQDNDVEDMPRRGSRGANAVTDLKAWQSYYQKSKIFPQPTSPQTSPASAAFIALGRYQKELDELLEASKRPDAQLLVHHEEEPKFSVSMGDIGSTLNMSNVLALHAVACLHSGQSEKAWADLRVLLKFHQACEKEPAIISHLVGITVIGIMLDPIWEGLALNAWQPRELAEISTALGQLDILRGFHHNIRGEAMFFMIPTMDYLKNNGDTTLGELMDSPSMWEVRLIHHVIPKGCYDMAKVSSIQMLYERVLPLIDVKEHRYSTANAVLLDQYAQNLKSYSPIDWILNLITPSYKTAAQRSVETQSDVDLARIACLLEIYRLHNGHYPKDLTELGEPLPHDIISGKAYFYKTTPNGRFRLWGVGWNESDDAGEVAFKDPKNTRVDKTRGDWVWAYPDKIPVP